MQLEHAFTVPVGIDEAWAVLLDIERVAPCMPGAAIDSIDGDDFTGTVKVKLGPIGLTYKGKASFVEKDEAGHKAVIRAQGRDARGNGTAAATVTAVLIAEGDTTKVAVTTDLDITGKPAQFGRGVMADVGNKLIGQFADCLAGQLTEGDGSHSAEAPTAEIPTASPTDTTAELPAATPATADAAASAAAPAKKAPAKKAAAKKAPAKGSGAAASAGAPEKQAAAKKTAAASTGGSTASASVNGSATESANGSAAAPSKPPVRPAPREVEPIDLMQSAGPAVAKRLAPVVAGMLLLIVLLRLLRRSR